MTMEKLKFGTKIKLPVSSWHPLVEKYGFKILDTPNKGCSTDQTIFYILDEFRKELLKYEKVERNG